MSMSTQLAIRKAKITLLAKWHVYAGKGRWCRDVRLFYIPFFVYTAWLHSAHDCPLPGPWSVACIEVWR